MTFPGRALPLRARAAPVAAILLALGCRGADDPPAEPRPTAPAETPAAPTGPVTFARDVAPILFQRCSPCHRPGQAGPFPLLTYEDARKRAGQIAAVTAERIMPPWPPDPGYGRFAGERRLSAEAIALLGLWAEAGAPMGDPADPPAPPDFPEGWALGKPDLALEMGDAFLLPAEGADLFRNFWLPRPTGPALHVRAVEFRPDNPGVIHHAMLLVDPTGESRRLEAADAAPGFDAEMEVGSATIPDGQFVGWTPGKVPRLKPEASAWRLNPASDLVLQLHLLPSGRPEPVRVAVGLHLAAEPPAFPPFLLRLGSKAIDIPPGAPDYRIDDAYTLPVPVKVLSLYPHAHYLGRDIQAWARLPDGEKRWLIRIKHWDFNRQDEYELAEPMLLPAGARLYMRYTYDNSAENPRNPSRPPRRVRFGGRSTDEMGYLLIEVLTGSPADRAHLAEDFWAHETEKEIEAHRARIAADRRDPAPHRELAALLLRRGDTEAAVRHFRRALELGGSDADGHYNLGLAFSRAGRANEAAEAFARALAIRNDFVEALAAIAEIELSQGDAEGALQRLRRAVALEPDRAVTRLALGRALRLAGRLEAAEAACRAALELEPPSAAGHYQHGLALKALGRTEAAIAALGRAVAFDPTQGAFLSDLGNTLAAAGRPAEALPHYREALRLDPEDALTHYNYALALARLGQVALAEEHYARALRLRPDLAAKAPTANSSSGMD